MSASASAAGTALLVMDIQNGVASRILDPEYLPRVARAIAAARHADVPVIHVGIGFRPGHPEVHPRNKTFAALPKDAFVHKDPAVGFHPAVAPAPGEATVFKNRVNAFAGNDLHQILAAGGVGHLVLAGIATGGVVLSTACLVADLDYRLTVLADGCADPDPALHHLLVEKVFARRGEVPSVDEWARSLPGAHG
ncbi:isochorismatase family cysteine hydrolase [Streptomyces sp. NPDC057697]|uniref:isochorismatase family cysteine hydrolase n=1 Tax=Streptomyces sp. NPDC057697 TaxID=3346219 RepID=UPI0036CB2376